MTLFCGVMVFPKIHPNRYDLLLKVLANYHAGPLIVPCLCRTEYDGFLGKKGACALCKGSDGKVKVYRNPRGHFTRCYLNFQNEKQVDFCDSGFPLALENRITQLDQLYSADSVPCVVIDKDFGWRSPKFLTEEYGWESWRKKYGKHPAVFLSFELK